MKIYTVEFYGTMIYFSTLKKAKNFLLSKNFREIGSYSYAGNTRSVWIHDATMLMSQHTAYIGSIDVQ